MRISSWAMSKALDFSEEYKGRVVKTDDIAMLVEDVREALSMELLNWARSPLWSKTTGMSPETTIIKALDSIGVSTPEAKKNRRRPLPKTKPASGMDDFLQENAKA